MPVNHDLRCVFVHIPKTAGVSIGYALGMHGSEKHVGLKPYVNQKENLQTLFGGKLSHLSAADIQKLEPKYHEYFSFSFVRNPYDRVLSHFCWLNQKWYKGIRPSKNEFSTWLEQCSFRHKHLTPQYNYLYHNDDLLVDFVGRFESLETDFSSICSTVGIRVSLEQRMKSSHDNYSKYYDDHTRAIVAEKYAKDFETFGYAL